MKNVSKIRSFAILSVALIAGSAAAAGSYQISSIGVLAGGTYSEAYGINSRGQVAGISNVSNGQVRGIFYNGSLQMLGPGLGGSHARAYDVNDNGLVAGYRERYYSAAGIMRLQGVVWNPGVGVTTIANFGAADQFESIAYGVSNDGVAVGSASGQSGQTSMNPMMWTSGGGTVWIGTYTGLPSSNGLSTGVSDNGVEICGYSFDANGINRPFRRSGNTTYQLSGFSPGAGVYVDTMPRAINNNGLMVGNYKVDFNTNRAFRRTAGGSFISLGYLTGPGGSDDDSSFAEGVNNNGDIVGFAEIGNGNYRAILIPSGGSMIDLNTMLPANSGWVLQFAHDINDNGWICGTGIFNGAKRGFVMKPICAISGKITLQNWIPSLSGASVTIEISDSVTNQLLAAPTCILSGDGSYSFITDQVGANRKISLKVWHWLRQSMTGTISTNPINLDFFLINGDVDNDNEVNLFDFALVASGYGKAWGDPGYNGNYDLDGDDEVTLVDLGIVNANFGQLGDD